MSLKFVQTGMERSYKHYYQYITQEQHTLERVEKNE